MPSFMRHCHLISIRPVCARSPFKTLGTALICGWIPVVFNVKSAQLECGTNTMTYKCVVKGTVLIAAWSSVCCSMCGVESSYEWIVV